MADELKRSRLRRALSLSRLGARLAVGQGKRLLARDQSAAHREMAKAMVAELGKLKGLPMKLGQILSYMDGVVPAEYEDVYQDVLGELRTHSNPMPRDTWREVFFEELGRTPEELFDSVEAEPIAAASIGQVHRARLDGEPVCFKVQYPGVAEATVADFENVELIISVLHRIMPNVDTRRAVLDFRERLEEECDYRIEAEYQRRFRQLYADDPSLMVPEVISSLSTRRVLTSRFVEGISLDSFVKNASDEERDRAGRTLFRFAFGTLVQHGLFHADPHPGNLLFDADGTGKLCILDYGCVQPIDEHAQRDIASLLRAAMDGRDLNDATRRAFGIREMDDTTAATLDAVVRLVLAPILAPQPYTFTRAFAADISRAVVDAKMSLATNYLSRRGAFSSDREGVMFVVRNLFGLAAIWGKLGATGDFRELTSTFVDAVPEASYAHAHAP